MESIFTLHAGDWLVMGLYMALALGVGFAVKKRAGTDRTSYFLAGRALPWWWAGASMAATTFAADTPLAVTGIIAAKGLSGNWLWLPVMSIHAAVFVFFAANWSRSGVLTDAELIQLRYSGTPARFLRWCRAGLQLLTNCVVLGWVLRAMVKIASPFFLWEQWIPGLMEWIAPIWPTGTALGTPSEGLTVLVLLLVVGCYSSLGGLRGVILTDLVQLCLALLGSTWLAVIAWRAVDGRAGLLAGLTLQYGHGHQYLDLFPTPGSGWLGAVGISAFIFGLYLIVQSYSHMSADGGGYFMQRLNAARSPRDAQKAAFLFLVIHYLVRVWPWFVVGLVALVLIPLGQEAEALNGAAIVVQGDREMAWPVLMAYLLTPGWLGVVLVSLLAAFMSTVDTHINWGASYIVNDVWLVLHPTASNREQMRVARTAVLLFVVVAIVTSAKIDTIAQAWKWIALLGASLGLPTLLRWLWWRVNAAGEIGAMLGGLCVGTLLTLYTDLPYEIRLIWVATASLIGLLTGIVLGPSTDPECLHRFVDQVSPLGVWPHNPMRTSKHVWELAMAIGRWVVVVAGTLLLLIAGHQFLFVGRWIFSLIAGMMALGLLWVGIRLKSLPAEP
jgi:SSS family solute:Na+ symporter